jgi:DNA-binding NarL/FixJ family response regulator
MSALAELQPAVDLPNDSIQVLILDSHAITRIGLAVLLQRQPWVSRCLLAAERDAAAELAARHRPEVAIVDVSNAGPFAAAEVAPLRAAHRAMPIVLSSRTRAAAAVPPTALDAVGFLGPNCTPIEVVRTVRGALVGEHQHPRRQPRQQASAPRGLSEREREVLALLSTGATNREIAEVMHVGTETVKKHAHALYRKLGVRNRTEAAQRASDLLAA